MLAFDCDDRSLRDIARTASPFFDVQVTQDARRYFSLLDQLQTLSVVIVQQALIHFDGITLLEKAASMHPRSVRILMSDYRDLAPLVNGLHSGVVTLVLPAPFTANELLACITPPQLTMQKVARPLTA